MAQHHVNQSGWGKGVGAGLPLLWVPWDARKQRSIDVLRVAGAATQLRNAVFRAKRSSAVGGIACSDSFSVRAHARVVSWGGGRKLTSSKAGTLRSGPNDFRGHFMRTGGGDRRRLIVTKAQLAALDLSVIKKREWVGARMLRGLARTGGRARRGR